MSLSRKLVLPALAAAVLATGTFATMQQAEAFTLYPRHRHHHHFWPGVGIAAATGLAVGGLIAASRPAAAAPAYVSDGPVRRCGTVERVNRYGEVIGYRRVCRWVD
jgi:hypothetical protein